VLKFVKIVALASSVVAVSSLTVWYFANDISIIEIGLTGITTIATVILAMTVYQLDITLKQLRFDSLNRIYDYLHTDVKKEIKDIIKWAYKREPADKVMESEENWDKVRFVSAIFNRIGYYVYKDFIKENFIQEQFAGLVIRSFVAIRPYLQYMRSRSEPANKPWLMRRFYLLIVVICEKYIREKLEYNDYIANIVEKYGDESTIDDFKRGSLVPVSWLADDVKKWLTKRGYL